MDKSILPKSLPAVIIQDVAFWLRIFWRLAGTMKTKKWLYSVLAGGVFIVLIILVGAAAGGARNGAEAAPSPPRPNFVAGEVLVKFRPETDLAQAQGLLQAMDALVVDRAEWIGIHKLQVPSGQEEAVAARLSRDPRVLYAVPNYIAYAQRDPNDPYYQQGHQWALPQIRAPLAWDISTGSSAQIVIAVLDTGVDLDHPDLSSKLISGWDFANNDNYPDDDNGHGTHAAGIAAAVTNNQVGVAGMVWGARILPVKVLDNQGAGSYYNIIKGIGYALDRGARIINMSFAGSAGRQDLLDAVTTAYNQGALLVAAAGNCAQGGPDCAGVNPVMYPAAYAPVVSVAAVDRYDNWASYSEYNAYVDIAAPGGTSAYPIVSTIPGTYGWKYGTSMATPFVSGLAALIWNMAPNLTNEQVINLILESADKVGPYPYSNGRNDYFGHGRINAERALRRTDPPRLQVSPNPLIFLSDDQRPRSAQGRLYIRNLSQYVEAEWHAVKLSSTPWFTLTPPTEGVVSATRPATLTVQADRGTLPYGAYSGTLEILSTTPDVEGSPALVEVWLSYVPNLKRVWMPIIKKRSFDLGGYQWWDVRDGQLLAVGDDGFVQVNLPFSFPFYGQSYNQVFVAANGLLSFGNGYSHYQPHCLPNPGGPNNAIYAFWTDLDPTASGGVYAKKLDDWHFVVEWYSVPRYNSSDQETFEVLLRSDGHIRFQYQSVAASEVATVGVENANGTQAWQYRCPGQGPLLSNGQVIDHDYQQP